MARVKIVTFAPVENADAIRNALGVAGAGILGEYTFCSYSVTGVGRFLPSANTNPHIGIPGVLESVEEERIEVTCARGVAKKVIAAMKATHPYEEVAFDVYQLIDESDI